MDNDVFVRPGWLPPLVQCENETFAGARRTFNARGRDTASTVPDVTC